MSKSMKVYTVVTGTVLAIVLAGAATALPGTNTVDSADIINGQVKRPDIAANAVNGAKVADGSLTGADVANGSLTGGDISESTLNFSDSTCSLEAVHSFARIKGSASMPATFTTSSTYVDIAHNCSGGTVEVRRQQAGVYFIRFNGDPALLASVTSMWDESGLDNNYVTMTARDRHGAGTGIRVTVHDHDGSFVDGWLNIMTY